MLFEDYWKSQVLLSKASGISMETSDTFTKFEFDLCFQALEEFNKEQERQFKEQNS